MQINKYIYKVIQLTWIQIDGSSKAHSTNKMAAIDVMTSLWHMKTQGVHCWKNIEIIQRLIKLCVFEDLTNIIGQLFSVIISAGRHRIQSRSVSSWEYVRLQDLSQNLSIINPWRRAAPELHRCHLLAWQVRCVTEVNWPLTSSKAHQHGKMVL